MTGFHTDPVLGDCFLIDSSGLEPITTCPYRAYLSVLRKKKRNREEPALRFGGIIHEALGYRYKMMHYRKCKTSAIINISNLLPRTMEEVQLRITERLFTSRPCEAEDWRNLGTATEIIRKYNEEYESEDFHIAEINGLPFVEKPFNIICDRIAGVLVIYIGRIDLAVYDSKGKLYIIDHKTTSMLGEGFWQDAAVSEQQRGYCWAATKAGLPQPTGYYINALACRKPTKSGTAIEFARRIFYLGEDDLSRWYQNMMHQVETFLWHHKRKIFPQHHKHCITKYGACEFYDLCKQHPDSHEDSLASHNYTDNVWTPLK